MALSVRLPAGRGPHVEHFLIEKQDGQLSLESSDSRFDSISSLVARYSSRCDELPVLLRLPESLQHAESRHQLSSRALLGQEFWQSRLASSPSGGSTGVVGSTQSSTASSSLSKPHSSQSSLGSLGSPPGVQTHPHNETLTSQSSLSSSSNGGGGGGQAESPLTTFGRRPLPGRSSPVSLVPISEQDAEPAGSRPVTSRCRPTPPSSLQLRPAGGQRPGLLSPRLVNRVSSPTGGGDTARPVPPKPPPRWCKPSLTPPATTMFSQTNSGQVRSEVSMFIGGHSRAVRSASNTPVRELGPDVAAPVSMNGAGWRPQAASPVTTPASCDDDVMLSGAARASRRRGRKKRSAHYQEADILELPTAVFCRSAVADKISDYEDIWASPPRELKPESTFKPRTAARSMNDLSDAARSSAEPAAPAAGEGAGLRLDLAAGRLASPLTPLTPRSPAGNSPFYAVPADAVRSAAPDGGVGVQRRIPFDRTASHRHSEPNIRWEPPGRARPPPMETIDSSDELPPLSSSVDNLSAAAPAPRRLRPGARSQSSHGIGETARRGKPVQPPRVQSPRRPRVRRTARQPPWRGEPAGADNEGFEADTEAELDEDSVQLRRGVEARNAALRLSDSTTTEAEQSDTQAISKEEESRIVEAYIRQSLPQVARSADLPLPPPPDPASSDYDNVRSDPCRPAPGPGPRPDPTEATKWESIMRLMDDQLRLRSGQFDESAPPLPPPPPQPGQMPEDRLFTDSESFVHCRGGTEDADSETAASDATRRPPTQPRAPQESLYSPPRLNSLRLHRRSQQSGGAIKDYVNTLAADTTNTFALNVVKFLQCTREASETDPHVVMRNTRQFVNGMKNYLVKHGERDFHTVVLQERNKLTSTEFLNLDVILEGVLEELLILPLHDHVRELSAAAARRTGAIQRLSENLELARGRSAALLGLKPDRAPPSAAVLDGIRKLLAQMEAAASPLDKLERLLDAISALFAAAGARDAALPADEFLPLLLYTLVHCDVSNVEFEMDYMWSLLHPLLLNGEAGYYLTMLSSAVHVLKNLPLYLGERSRGSSHSLSHCSGSVSGSEPGEGLLRVIIPDEQQGTLLSRTLPARPDTCTRDVCKMLGNKLRITSPSDYGLFQLIDGNETLLGDSDCPQLIKQQLSVAGTHCLLAYKRLEAKIAWPTAQL